MAGAMMGAPMPSASLSAWQADRRGGGGMAAASAAGLPSFLGGGSGLERDPIEPFTLYGTVG